jgi:hypothetical protein
MIGFVVQTMRCRTARAGSVLNRPGFFMRLWKKCQNLLRSFCAVCNNTPMPLRSGQLQRHRQGIESMTNQMGLSTMRSSCTLPGTEADSTELRPYTDVVRSAGRPATEALRTAVTLSQRRLTQFRATSNPDDPVGYPATVPL